MGLKMKPFDETLGSVIVTTVGVKPFIDICGPSTAHCPLPPPTAPIRAQGFPSPRSEHVPRVAGGRLKHGC